jgi:hypothetical protein
MSYQDEKYLPHQVMASQALPRGYFIIMGVANANAMLISTHFGSPARHRLAEYNCIDMLHLLQLNKCALKTMVHTKNKATKIHLVKTDVLSHW